MIECQLGVQNETFLLYLNKNKLSIGTKQWKIGKQKNRPTDKRINRRKNKRTGRKTEKVCNNLKKVKMCRNLKAIYCIK